MTTPTSLTRIKVKNVLYLTDFSEPSEAALPYAAAIAREFGGKLYALHVLTPQPYVYSTPETTVTAMEAQEEAAQEGMERAGAHLAGLVHETIIENELGVWPAVERAIKELKIDMIVVGTHGRSGIERLLLGSVAEEIFRRSPVPVLTIGPWAAAAVHNGAKFHRIVFATDFTKASLAAAPYAIALAQENQSRLTLLHVMKERSRKDGDKFGAISVADAMHSLLEIVPPEAELWCRPEAAVQYGNPPEKILEAAKDRGADLIVLGVRSATGHLGAATHVERATAHNVVAHAQCPVLTVRG